MNIVFWTADRETGTLIEAFNSLYEALEAIKRYELMDTAEGSYEPDFYDIVDTDRCSVLNTPGLVKAYRKATGLSQQKLADWFGMPKRVWQSWELGERTPADWILNLVFEKIERDLL